MGTRLNFSERLQLSRKQSTHPPSQVLSFLPSPPPLPKEGRKATKTLRIGLESRESQMVGLFHSTAWS